MNESKEITLLEKTKTFISSSFTMFAKHRLVLISVIIGAALTFALLKTQSFIDVPRNEDRYNEELLQINYKEIDDEILAEFKASDQDGKIEVNSSFDPDRKNPFTE